MKSKFYTDEHVFVVLNLLLWRKVRKSLLGSPLQWKATSQTPSFA